MSAVDRVAVYEAGVTACHGAPQRDCCVRRGIANVLHDLARQIDREADGTDGGYVDGIGDATGILRQAAVELTADTAPTPTPAPEPVPAATITTTGGRIITAALAWRDNISSDPRNWADRDDLELIAAVDAYRAPEVDYPGEPAAEVGHPAEHAEPDDPDWPAYLADAYETIRREVVPYVPLLSARIADRAARELDAAGMLRRPGAAEVCRLCGRPVGWMHTEACPRWATESGVRPEGWGAMLQHGAPAPQVCTCGKQDITEFGNTSAKPLPVRGITDPDCPTHGTPEQPSRTAHLVEWERMGFAVGWSLERRRAPKPTTPDQES